MKTIKLTTLFSILVFTLILITPVTSMAQTKEFSFDLKVGSASTKYSLTKAGGDSFEKKYYLTQTFTATPTGASRSFQYYPVYNGKQVANGLNLSYSNRSKHNNTYYSGQAKAGRQYRLHCKCTGSGSLNSYSTVTGKWTP